MPKLLLLKGLPASGKSTYARSLVEKGWKRVNKDDLRAMLDNGKWGKKNEDFILAVRNFIVLSALSDGLNVVVDDTNLHPKHATFFELIAESKGVDYEEKFFDVDVDECVRRDLKRPVSVGEAVIRNMYKQFLQKASPAPKYDPNLPDVVICDLDGTLAHSTTRGWYDTEGFETDTLDATISTLLATLPDNMGIIFVSGRSEDGRTGTQEWLNKHGWGELPLLMRPSGDMRKDSIIKQEIYDEHIRGKYNVFCVFDDRNQVVEMWRANGLKVLQCADGNF